MVTISDLAGALRVLFGPEMKKETIPPNRTTASMMPMNKRCLLGLRDGGGNGGRGDIFSLLGMNALDFVPHFGGCVARPICVMPVRPRTSRTSMIA